MENEKWKVRLRQPEERLGVDVLIYRYVSSGMQVINFTEKGIGIITTIERGCVIEAPTMRLDYDAKEILNALMVAGDEFGVKRPEQSYVEGELTATKQHLADMRTLVFPVTIAPGNARKDHWKGKPLSKLTDKEWADFEKNVRG